LKKLSQRSNTVKKIGMVVSKTECPKTMAAASELRNRGLAVLLVCEINLAFDLVAAGGIAETIIVSDMIDFLPRGLGKSGSTIVRHQGEAAIAAA
jgi:hypothetical protein